MESLEARTLLAVDTLPGVAEPPLVLVDEFFALRSAVAHPSSAEGEMAAGDAQLRGYVYLDANDDGQREGDVGIPGVEITLTGVDDRGNLVERVELSAHDGWYAFTDLAAGIYEIAQRQPAATHDGPDTIGRLGGGLAADRFSNIVLGPGKLGIEYNFGERGLKSEFIERQLSLLRTHPIADVLRHLVAEAEELVGNLDLAERIRAVWSGHTCQSEPPSDDTPDDAPSDDNPPDDSPPGDDPPDDDPPVSESPTLAAIDDVTLLAGSPLHIALDGFDPQGDALTFTVTSDDPLVSATLLEGNRSMRVKVADFGEMVFELFEGRAPRPVERLIELAESGFYDGLTFHRVADGFVIQAGGVVSPLGTFDDQFHEELQHNRSGVLSFAKKTDDSNSGDFFITAGAERHLDFNYSIIGQLVEGETIRAAINDVPVELNDATPPELSRPVSPVTIESVEIFVDQENGVLVLSAPEGTTGSANITVTVSDASGNVATRTFAVTVEPDVANGGPFLEDIPPVETTSDEPVTFTLAARDVEGDPVIFTGRRLGEVEFGLDVDPITGEVTVTPPTGFVGALAIEVRVEPAGSSDTFDRFDRQMVTIEVTPVVGGNALASGEEDDEDRFDLTFASAIDDAEFAQLVDEVLGEEDLLRLP